MDHAADLFDQGLQADLVTLIDRRRVLRLRGSQARESSWMSRRIVSGRGAPTRNCNVAVT